MIAEKVKPPLIEAEHLSAEVKRKIEGWIRRPGPVYLGSSGEKPVLRGVFPPREAAEAERVEVEEERVWERHSQGPHIVLGLVLPRIETKWQWFKRVTVIVPGETFMDMVEVRPDGTKVVRDLRFAGGGLPRMSKHFELFYRGPNDLRGELYVINCGREGPATPAELEEFNKALEEPGMVR